MDKAVDSCVEVGVASRTLPGQSESGDLYFVRETPVGALLGVVDGLGHGTEAATAARIAVETIASSANEEVTLILKNCHARLKQTRGAVMSLGLVNARDDTVTWLTIGNIEGIRLRPDPPNDPLLKMIVRHKGIVGYKLPELKPSVFPLKSGDFLVAATDGIAFGFERELRNAEYPQLLADRICERHAKSSDDALVLVVKYIRRHQ